MSVSSSPIRCKRCNTQLASRDPDGICICRGGLEATITGSFTVSFRCYRCDALTVVTSVAPQEQRPTPRTGVAPV